MKSSPVSMALCIQVAAAPAILPQSPGAAPYCVSFHQPPQEFGDISGYVEFNTSQSWKAEIAVVSDGELEDIFRGLVKIWQDSTGGLSSPKRKFAHPTYRAILKLGPSTVPFILRELHQR